MSKAAANMAGQLLALELGQKGVPVVLIHPGAVTTDMYYNYWAAVGPASNNGGGGGGGGGGGNGSANRDNSAEQGGGGAAGGSTSDACAAGSSSGGGGSAGSTGTQGRAPSAHGAISPPDCAAGILQRLDKLDLSTTGRFVQAATGEELPW